MKKLFLIAILLVFALFISSCSDNLNSTPEVKNASYSLLDIADHNTKEDCWLAIEGKVYDVTEFIPSHPGGDKIINGCGKDATQMFSKHPASAKEKLPNYLIGSLI